MQQHNNKRITSGKGPTVARKGMTVMLPEAIRKRLGRAASDREVSKRQVMIECLDRCLPVI